MGKSENLQILNALLQKRKTGFTGVYFIPETWNYFGYTDFSRHPGREREISVNPFAFFSACLQNIMKQNTALPVFAEMDGTGNITAGENICRRVIYGMFIRAHSAWNHYNGETIVPGTYLKSLSLLPLLQELGVDLIYLLPVFKSSAKYKKGEIGSPYAIKNLYQLDENLHDALLGECTEELLAREFKAFIEACHILGMKVILDFVFRTVARDNDLILDHPDWFYWIDKKYNEDFQVPAVEKEKKLTVVQDGVLKNLYTCPGITEYLGRFRHSPDKIDARRWQQVKERQAQSGANILTLIEEEFGVTTVPGFSDIINDPQPPWTDVTYLKYYFDLHPKARRYVVNPCPPFILQDGACLNLYQGEMLNRELWDYIVGVIPFYQTEYGINGARIDMSHALPTVLLREIVKVVREKDPQFILWSEEFSVENSTVARDDGFDFITGNLWSLYKKYHFSGFQKKVLKELRESVLPVAAAPETPDTPRFAHVYRRKSLREFLLLFNFFLPNTVPFLNNGLELAEIQPMNLGLENTEAGRFVLDRIDPLYGKLAFFDYYCLHWLNEDQAWMKRLLGNAVRLRQRFIDTLAEKENFLADRSRVKDKRLFFLCYRRGDDGLLFFLANKDQRRRIGVDLRSLLVGRKGEIPGAAVVYARGKPLDEHWPAGKMKILEPGEVVIGYTAGV